MPAYMKLPDIVGEAKTAFGADSFTFTDPPQQVALLLPAVQAAREAARRAVDENEPNDMAWRDDSPLADDVVVDGRIITAEDWF